MVEMVIFYDVVFKIFFLWVEMVCDFIEFYLFLLLIQICKLDILCLEFGSFFEDDFRFYYSDIFYLLEIICGVGYVYVLIEYQSVFDKLMVFCLMCYVIVVMQWYLESGYKMLFLVIFIFFYQG